MSGRSLGLEWREQLPHVKCPVLLVTSDPELGGGTFTNNGGTVVGAFGGSTQFANTSTAGSATLIANGGTGAGGSIFFFDDSIGGTASVDVRNNGTGTAGNLDISAHNAPAPTPARAYARTARPRGTR